MLRMVMISVLKPYCQPREDPVEGLAWAKAWRQGSLCMAGREREGNLGGVGERERGAWRTFWDREMEGLGCQGAGALALREEGTSEDFTGEQYHAELPKSFLTRSMLTWTSILENVLLHSSYKPIVEYIDAQFEAYLQEELKIKRSLFNYHDTRIHACLYFIAPTGHSLKSLDLVTMKKLDSKVLTATLLLDPCYAKASIYSLLTM